MKVFVLIALLVNYQIQSISSNVNELESVDNIPWEKYERPKVSAGKCLEVIDKFVENSIVHGMNSGSRCMSCDVAQEICPYDALCQKMIDRLYRDCEGVSLPEGSFFDPALSITGTWSDRVKDEIKISVEKCGCSSGSIVKSHVFGRMAVFFVFFLSLTH